MVERGATPRISALRRQIVRVAQAMTTPLVPDDYLELLNPALVGAGADRHDRAGHARSPSRPRRSSSARRFPWPGHRPGQYLRIGAELNGIRHWRAYSLTSDPDHPEGLVSITVKYVEEGLMSPWFTRKAQPDQLVYLGDVEGEFRLPDPLPERSLFISAGSGITPIWSMLRELERRDALDDIFHVHSAREPDLAIFGDYLRRMAGEYDGYTFHEQLTGATRRLVPADLDDLCPDWRDRDTFLSGPRDMIDTFEQHWEAEGIRDRLRTERFQPIIGTRRRRGRKRRHRQLPDHRLRGEVRARASRSSSAARRPAATSPTAAGWGSATPASASCEAARCATCGPARSTASRARRSGPASTPPRARSRSTCDVGERKRRRRE